MASSFPPPSNPMPPPAGGPIATRRVEAGAGASWWAVGWRIFTAHIGTWIGIVVVYFILSGLLSRVPYIGALAQSLLSPVFVGGIMAGCSAVDRGGPLRFTHLFEGFKEPNFIPLLIIGAVNIGFLVAIVLIMFAGFAGSIGLSVLLGNATPDFDPYALWEGLGFGMLIGALAVLVLVAVVAMLNWFAPALVVLRGAPPIEAMKASFRACMRNWVPFLVYGAIGMAIMLAALVVFVIVFAMAGVSAAFGGDGGWERVIGGIVVLGILAFTFGLVLTPLVFASTFASYRDNFAAAGEETTGTVVPR